MEFDENNEFKPSGVNPPAGTFDTPLSQVGRYLHSYNTDFGRELIKREAAILRGCLGGCTHILDVGCGPGVFERELSELDIVGVDSDNDMIDAARALSENRFDVGSAEELPFPDDAFDCVFFVSSLSFIDDFKKAIDETIRVLSSGGRIAALMCNPKSDYFKSKLVSGGYTAKNVKHTELEDIVSYISERFDVEGGFQLGIKGREVFDSHDPKEASLYVLQGALR